MYIGKSDLGMLCTLEKVIPPDETYLLKITIWWIHRLALFKNFINLHMLKALFSVFGVGVSKIVFKMSLSRKLELYKS